MPTKPLSRSHSLPVGGNLVRQQSQGTTPPAKPQAQGAQGTTPPPAKPQAQGAQGTTPPPAKQPSEKLMDVPLDAHGHAPAGTLSAPMDGMQVGALGPDYKLASAPAGASEKKIERQAAFRTYGDLEKNGVALGMAKVEGKAFTHRAAGTLHTQAQGEANLLAVTAHGEKKWTSKLGQGSAEAKFDAGLKASGEALALVNKHDKQAVLHAKGEALAGAQAEVTAKQDATRHFHAAGKGELKAGTWGSGQATAAFEPKKGTAMVRVGGEGWAGAEQKAQGELKMGWLRLSGGIGAKQGVGGEFKFGAGMQSGRLGIQFDVGAAVGFGGSLSVGASLNAKAMAKKTQRGWHKVSDAIHHRPAQKPQTTAAQAPQATQPQAAQKPPAPAAQAPQTQTAQAPQATQSPAVQKPQPAQAQAAQAPQATPSQTAQKPQAPTQTTQASQTQAPAAKP